MNLSIVKRLGLAASLCTGLTMFGCQAGNETHVEWQGAGPPHFVNTHQTWWNYIYVYHPYAEVYFEPYTSVYWWRENDQWISGYPLPDHIELDHSTAQVIRSQTEMPWQQHRQHQVTTMPPNPADPERHNSSVHRSSGF